MNHKTLWVAFAALSVLACSIVSGAPLVVMISSLAGILFVTCVAFGKPIGNLFGAIFNACLVYLSFEAGYFGNVGMAAVITVMHLWGWWYWSKDGIEVKKRELKRHQKAWLFIGTIVALMVSVVFSFASGANLWPLDGVTTVLPVIATILLVGAYKECWVFWFVFNILAFIMWIITSWSNPAVYALAVMKGIFLINSIIGYYEWNKSE